MDAVVGLSPPGIGAAFGILRFIVAEIQQLHASQKQLQVLAQALGQLLRTVDSEFKKSRLAMNAANVLRDLKILLEDVHRFVHKEQSRGFFKSLLTKDSRIAGIEGFYRRIESVVNSFQISSLVNVQTMLARDKAARQEDREILALHLNALEGNQLDLRATLDVNHHNVIAMMVSIRRKIDSLGHSNDPERQFYSHTLEYLSSTSGRQVEPESWMIPSFEVDYGPEIGVGGFGKVYRGTWNRADVAIKVLQSGAGITPNISILRREIDIWLTLRHPNILQFLGANTLDNKPFIVMPYVAHNARQFLAQRQDFNPIHILCDISRGLEYLHSRKICHGDLKGVNVLVDASERALLCDFGLAQVKADVTSRSNHMGEKGAIGSRNWMAPELLTGSPVKQSSDVYAFGMTVYELYTDGNPMSPVAYWDFVEVVFRLDVRPERPEPGDCLTLVDPMWALAESCWVKDPKSRPTSQDIHDIITSIISGMHVDPFADPFSTPEASEGAEANGEVESTWTEPLHEQGERITEISADRATELEQEVERIREALGDDHPDTLRAMENLARNCSTKRAREITEGVLEVRKMVLGEDHPDTLATMASLARIYYHLGVTSQAKDIGFAAMKQQKAILGDNHPNTLATMALLARILHAQEEYQEAEGLGILVTEQMKRVLGPEHINTLSAMNNLGRTHAQLGRLEKAEKIHLIVVAGRKHILGAADPETFRSMHNLAATYHQLGRFKQAMKLQVSVVDGLKEVLGGVHPDTLTAMVNLAKTYLKLGKLREAKELQLAVMARQDRFLGDEDSD